MKILSRTEWVALAALLAMPTVGCSSKDAELTLPSGTPLVVSLSSTSRSDLAESGQTLAASLVEDVLIEGATVLHAGQEVTLVVLEALPASEDAPLRLSLGLQSIEVAGETTRVLSEPLEVVGEILLPAGQRLQFVTSESLPLPRLQTAGLDG